MLHQLTQLYVTSFSGLRREVWYLAIVLFINRSGAMVIPFLTVYLTTSRGFTLQEAGWVMSAFGLGSLVGSYVGGYLTDRIGFHKIQQLTLIGSGLLFWVLGQMDSLLEMATVIFLLSILTDAFRPANQAAVAYYSKVENRSRSYGLLRLAVNLGFSVGPFLGGVLISLVGYTSLFWVDGLTCLLAAVAYRLLLPPGKTRPTEESEMEQTPIDQSPYRDIPYVFFVVCILFFAIAFMQFFGSLPLYLKKNLAFSEWQIGLLASLNALIIVFSEMPLVHQLSLRFRPLGIIALGCGLVGIGHLALLGSNLWIVAAPIVYILFITFGEILAMPFASTFAAARASAQRRGAYMGLLSIAYSLAFIIAPTLGMWVADNYGFQVLWIVTAGFAALATLGILVLLQTGMGEKQRLRMLKIRPIRKAKGRLRHQES